jgi:acetyl esterase/lipase
MTIERRTFLGSGIAMFAASAAAAQSPSPPQNFAGSANAPFFPPKERFPLWPGSPPGAPRKPIKPDWSMDGELDVRGVPVPEVNVFRPARADGSAMLAFPGGGYEFLSVQNEGLDPAERFNAERTTVFVLSYRLPGEGWQNRSLAPLQDAQRAMRLIRSRAADFHIDPARLGVLGFSAGGHLASDLGVSFDQPTYRPVDDADRLSARPAFLGLIYAVTTLEAGGHVGSRDTLLGANAPADLVASRSPVLHVSSATPPSFLVAAFDDDTVPVENSLNWVAAAQRAKVSVEAHLFAQGGHGFGLHLPKDNPGSRWPELLALWMRQHGG